TVDGMPVVLRRSMSNEFDVFVLTNAVPEGLCIKYRFAFWLDPANRKDAATETTDEQRLLGGIAGIASTADHGARIWGKSLFNGFIGLPHMDLQIM
ncbi:hypothetical protein EST38_g14535, partial [Candolleomyces aberdarensis]